MKKCKIRYKRVLIFLLVIVIIVLIIVKIFSLRITNIYISGNSYFNDQYFIELARIENYPRAVLTTSHSLENRIHSDIYVKDVNVKKVGLTKIYISIVENRPLFYDEVNGYTVLFNGEHTNDTFNLPILVNRVDESVNAEFVKKMGELDLNILSVISEIEYKPNDVDNKRFLLTMNDGNYVIVNLDKFASVNKYFDMVVNFNNHKGILYLDSGEYFKILDN